MSARLGSSSLGCTFWIAEELSFWIDSAASVVMSMIRMLPLSQDAYQIAAF